MDQTQTPLFDGLLAYCQNEKYSFHVPGHKDGLIFPEKGRGLFKSLLSIDATEVADLDDLYHPEGVIAGAEALLTDYYGTLASFFLVNGSTVGNLAMIIAACRPGDVVLVQRNSHKSIFNALKLARVTPVFLSPDIDEASQIATGIGPSVLTEAMRRYPQAKALVLTYPNYYGMAADYRPVIRQAHACGLAVLVDEAHGAHFKAGGAVPESTLDMEADIVVHSAHKMLPAMTMGAYLHINSLRVSKKKVKEALQMLQTSSPSYAIMASLDLARYYLANLDQTRLTRMIERRCGFVRSLEKMANVRVISDAAGKFRLDPFKVTVQLAGENGYSLQERLIAAGIYPELADPRHVLFVLGLTEAIDYNAALKEIENGIKSLPVCRPAEPPRDVFPRLSTLVFSYDELAPLRTEMIDMSAAKGRVSAQHVIPYPPGIPVILQGERITGEALESIESWKRSGAYFQNAGTDGGKISVYAGEGV